MEVRGWGLPFPWPLGRGPRLQVQMCLDALWSGHSLPHSHLKKMLGALGAAPLGQNNVPGSGLGVPTLRPRSPGWCAWLLPRQQGEQASIDSGWWLEECPFVELSALLLPTSLPSGEAFR